MNKFLLLTYFLLLSSQAVAGEWAVKMFGDNQSRAYIKLVSEGGASFTEAVDKVPESINSISIRVLCCLNSSYSEKINYELVNYYTKNIPEQFDQAMKSSGNLHNPALSPIHEYFTKAFKSTTLYAEIASVLGAKGYKLVDINYEKLLVFSNKEPYVFHADVWLRFEKNA